nr:unnamed protein product [Spirometra erinaceieuropaei]
MSESIKMLYFCGAKEFMIGHERAIVIYVPVPQLRTYHQLHNRLVGELEKKLRGAQVFICAFRRILPKPRRKCKTNPKQKRPRNRTLTSKSSASVHKNYVEHKLKTITGLYKKLSGKDVQIEFPEWVL